MPNDIIPVLELEAMTSTDDGGGTPPLSMIGIGASAGGLEALMELVKHLPKTANATYVVVQHMSPSHKSLLATLLARETHLTVKEAEDGAKPEANTIYVTPPKSDITYTEGVLRLTEPDASSVISKPSIDQFMTSLAQGAGEHAVGIVLSGTGSDGCKGVQAIREVGGVTIAQDGTSAKYAGMPMSAYETGFVDIVLTPRQIGTQLPDILRTPRDLERFRSKAAAEDPLCDLLQIVRARTQVDFTDYKRTTIQRRLERRMVALGIPDIAEYTRHCRAKPEEIDSLFKDFLISVTRFFRDKREFEMLVQELERIKKTPVDKVIRIWVAGCATGEEAYSIAMLLAEALGDKALRDGRLQIFATDIDPVALAKARLGRYSKTAADEIPQHLLEKYVTCVDDMIEMSATLRDVILFTEHNLCQDPPFLNIDLVSCRNLLIYFNTNLQSKVLGRFHYSLDKDGLLFLGIAETISVSEDLFQSVSGDKKLYHKRSISRSKQRARANEFSGALRSLSRSGRRERLPNNGEAPDQGMFEGLVRSVGPNSVLVSENLRIVRVFGDITPYISLNEGMRLQLSATMLVEPLNQDANMLTAIALKRGEHRSGTPRRLTPDAKSTVRMDAYPINDITGPDPLVLLTFTETEDQTGTELVSDNTSGDANARAKSLERELIATRDTLQQTVKELESSNDELKTLHEEMQSTNEELQATNGELETSNEELQSTNEELVTVNEELQISSMELSAVSDEQDTILENVAAALLIVDSALQIIKASAEAVQLFDMTEGFHRPHLSQVKTPENFPSMTEICLEVIQTGSPASCDVATGEGVYVMRCAPYSNNKGHILGATIIIARSSDTSELQSMMLKESKQLMMQRTDAGEIMRISEFSARVLGAKSAETLVGQNLRDVIGDAAAPVLQEDQDFLDSGEHVRTTEHAVLMPTGARRNLRMDRYRFYNSPGRPASIYSIAIDVTDERIAERKLRAQNEQLTMVSDIAKVGYWMIDLETSEITWSQQVYEIHGLSPAEFTPDLGAGLSFYHPDDRVRVTELVDAAMKDGEAFEFFARIVRADGAITPVHSSCRIILGADDEPLHIVGVFNRA